MHRTTRCTDKELAALRKETLPLFEEAKKWGINYSSGHIESLVDTVKYSYNVRRIRAIRNHFQRLIDRAIIDKLSENL